MERLTERYKGEAVVFCNQMCSDWNECNPILCQSKRILEKLAHYEDLEEQGLLLKLPCKVGTKVYEVTRYLIGKEWVTDGRDHLGGYGHYEYIYGWTIQDIKFRLQDRKRIGIDVFLTREEAEVKLKELKND